MPAPSIPTFVNRLVRTGSDLTVRQLNVLFACQAEPQTVRGLAEAMQVSKPAVSRAVDRLEAVGYVARQDDPSDRRSVLVKLTTGGQDWMVRNLAM